MQRERAGQEPGREVRGGGDGIGGNARPPWYEAMGERIPEGEIRRLISESPKVAIQFEKLSAERQRQFLDMCCGARGMVVCYDPFFKRVFDPMAHRERLSRFLTSILGRKVRVNGVLPNEGGRIVAGSPFVIMDILAEFEDGSLANIEIQRAGHLFPGQRAMCYSSDLVLRQYTAMKGKDADTALYGNMRNVYTIVIMEESVAEFHHPNVFIHRSRQKFNTGLRMPLLQDYHFTVRRARETDKEPMSSLLVKRFFISFPHRANARCFLHGGSRARRYALFPLTFTAKSSIIEL